MGLAKSLVLVTALSRSRDSPFNFLFGLLPAVLPEPCHDPMLHFGNGCVFGKKEPGRREGNALGIADVCRAGHDIPAGSVRSELNFNISSEHGPIWVHWRGSHGAAMGDQSREGSLAKAREADKSSNSS